MKKDILALFLAVLLVIVIIGGANIQSVDEYYLTHIDDITPESDTVYISITCGDVLINYEDLDPSLKSGDIIPPDGVILEKTEYVLRSGDTVFDILNRAVRYNHIQMEYQGADKNSFNTIYIQGINYLYEFSCGPVSGWTYYVNGDLPDKGCSDYKLSDGDVIEFVYVCRIPETFRQGGS